MVLLHCICFGVIWISPCTDDCVVRLLQKNGYSSRGDPSRNSLEQGHLQIQIIKSSILEVEHQYHGFWLNKPFPWTVHEPRKDDAHAEFLRSLASKEAGERSLHLWKQNSLHIQFLNLWFTLFCQGVPTSWSCLESPTLDTWQWNIPFLVKLENFGAVDLIGSLKSPSSGVWIFSRRTWSIHFFFVAVGISVYGLSLVKGTM